MEKAFYEFESEGNAELTNRLIDTDPDFNYPEWRENGYLDGVPAIIYYRTTPEDQRLATETNDWGSVDFGKRVDRIVINGHEADENDPKVQAVSQKYGIKVAY